MYSRRNARPARRLLEHRHRAAGAPPRRRAAVRPAYPPSSVASRSRGVSAARVATTSTIALARAAGRRPARPLFSTAIAASTAPATARAPIERTSPSRGTRTKPVRSEPAIPPAVLTAATSAHVAADVGGAGDEPGRGGKGGAQEHRRQQQDGGRRHDEAGHDFDRLPAREAHRPHARERLGLRQPLAEEEDRAHGARGGSAEQQPERPPRLASALAPAGEQEAAEREARQVGREHHGERVRARAQERHEQLGPDDLVAERDPAGDGVEREREAGVAVAGAAARRRKRSPRAPRAPIEGEGGRRRRRGRAGPRSSPSA